MSTRPRSPSACPAPWWAPQSAGPGPAQRRRLEEPAGPEPVATPVPVVPGAPGTEHALTSVAVLAEDCALQVPLGRADLVLAPAPSSVLQVSLGDHTLILVPEALVGSLDERSGEGDSPDGLELGFFPDQQGFFCASAPDTDEEDVDSEHLAPWLPAPAGSVAGPHISARRVLSSCSQGPNPEPSASVPNPSSERRSPGPYFNLDFHLRRPFPSSPLQPLPPSPSPDAHQRPQRSLRPPCKARRRLFQE
ncbi:proline-rich protein 23C-like [Dasypus novemcinctus]|uniref:proline-rich protein 23C-like n=1 Tax=Dasypus novemcinctus TaxID=9361 RepID=UPI0000E36872|nr:proline-rich protein 23C-like [Dasypus novemcinctus]